MTPEGLVDVQARRVAFAKRDFIVVIGELGWSHFHQLNKPAQERGTTPAICTCGGSNAQRA